jgi:hypothetical protein
MYPNVIDRSGFIFASVASVMIFLALNLAFPYLVYAGGYGLALIAMFLLKPLSLIVLCGALAVYCARRARTLGLAWAWGLAIPVLIGMDWMAVITGPLWAFGTPSAAGVPPPFSWAACSAVLLVAVFALLPTGAFLSEKASARLVGFALLFFVIIALAAGLLGLQSPYSSLAQELSQIAMAGLALTSSGLSILSLD